MDIVAHWRAARAPAQRRRRAWQLPRLRQAQPLFSRNNFVPQFKAAQSAYGGESPWLYEGRTPEQCERELKEYVEKLGRWVSEASEYSDASFRGRFEIDYQGRHVGSCASYLIDSDCNIVGDHDAEPLGRAIGICVFDPQYRRRGIASMALTGFIDYLKAHGSQRIFTQTWSGNERMTH